MKKVLVVLLVVVAMLFVTAGNKPPTNVPKPPKIVRLEIVNRAGEEVFVSLTGIGYDFNKMKWVGDWGVIHPRFYSTSVIGSITTLMPSGRTIVTKLPEVTKRLDVLKDLYIIEVSYAQESEGKYCLNSWAPEFWNDRGVYFAARGPNNKLVIKPCNAIPANIGAPGEGYMKYNRLRFLMAVTGYKYFHSQQK